MRPGRSETLQKWLSRLLKILSLVAYDIHPKRGAYLVLFINWLPGTSILPDGNQSSLAPWDRRPS